MEVVKVRTNAVDIVGCKRCQLHKNVVVFELCTHEYSAYTYDGKPEHHTCQHMRSGPCGPTMSLRVMK